MLVRFASLSCSFTTARCAFCRSSGRATSTAVCAATSNARAKLPRQTRTPCRILLTKTNQVFQLASKIAVNPDIAGEHEMVVDLEAHSRLLLTRSWINRSQIQIQSIENRVALSWLAFLDDLPVKLLYQ